MNKFILKKIAHIADRKLTRSDIRKIHKSLAQSPSEEIDALMCIINDRSRISERELSKLLIYSMSYRLRMPVREMYTYSDFQYGELGFYLCPNCGAAIEFDFQEFCGSCGQALGWDNCENVTIRRAGDRIHAGEEKIFMKPSQIKSL